MKFIAHVLILLLAAYGAFQLYEDYAPPEWPHWKTEEVQAPPPPPPPPPEQTIICKTCEGRGRLVDISGGTHIGYECPICKGLGKMTLPAAATRCNYCDGWRLVPRPKHDNDKEQGRVLADKCPICNSSRKR
jgi:phage FluMu protein Com